MGLELSRRGAAQVEGEIPSFARHLPVTQSAIRFARGVHAAQRRGSDEAPFILHPLEVAAMLYNAGAGDDVTAAGVLHDVVEDTATAIAEVREQFGGHIAALVMSLTEDPMIKSARDRKADLRAQVRRSGNEVGLIFAADKVAKARELRSLVAHDHLADKPSSEEIVDKLEHYAASLRMLEELLPEHPLVRQLRFELEALDGYPPEGMSALAQRTLANGMGGQTRVRAEPPPSRTGVPSEAGLRDDPALFHGLGELSIVALVLVGVGL